MDREAELTKAIKSIESGLAQYYSATSSSLEYVLEPVRAAVELVMGYEEEDRNPPEPASATPPEIDPTQSLVERVKGKMQESNGN